MFFLYLMRILRGTVRITLSGGFPERFLNLCAYRGISLWALARNNGMICGNVMANHYRQMRGIARKTGVRMRIVKKSGLPFIFFRYRNRPGIPVGCVVFTAFLIFMSSFIWNVEISGLDKLEESEIRASLAKLGLTEGARISDIKPAVLRTELLLQNPALSWASVNLEGCYAVVEASEVRAAEKEGELQVPVDIKAKRDGRIIIMEVYEGTALAEKGEAVVEGDTLVSGTVTYSTGEVAYKHARAKIIAQTNPVFSYKAPLKQTITVRTGEQLNRYALKIFGIRIPLYLGSVKGSFELDTTRNPLIIDNIRLPAELGKGVYSFTQQREVHYTPEQALALARGAIEKREKDELGQSEIKGKHEFVDYSEEWVKLTINYSCEENISVEENLLINNVN